MEIKDSLHRGESVHGLAVVADSFLVEVDAPGMWNAVGLASVFIDPLIRRVDPAISRQFVARAIQSRDTALRQWAVSTERRVYGDTTFQLKGMSLAHMPIDLAAYRGKVVVVDTWGTGCSGCIAAFPWLTQLYTKFHARGVEFVGLVIDDEDRRQRVTELVRRFSLPWPQIFTGDERKRYEEYYGIAGLPLHFIIDRQGRLVASGSFGEYDLERLLERVLTSGT